MNLFAYWRGFAVRRVICGVSQMLYSIVKCKKNVHFKDRFFKSVRLSYRRSIFITLVCLGLYFSLYVGLYWLLVDHPSSVKLRTIETVEGISLLWEKEMNIDNPYQPGVSFFTPNEQSVVFWSPLSNSLISLDSVTGNILWESKVPSPSTMRHYGDKFFVVSHQWMDMLDNAPVDSKASFPDCSFAGDASLLTYDPQTGQQLWGYVYQGVNYNNIYFEDDYNGPQKLDTKKGKKCPIMGK